jgi:cytoskeletal protein CcmA (bactofilin family)
MFSSKSKDASPTPQPVPVVQQAQPKRTRALSAPSIISADMVINGTINSTGDIQVDGRVEGDVRSVGLVIGDNAEISGEVLAEDVTVRGKVFGRIRARKVLLAATCHVEGDILHEAFAVESGAFFEGNCRHSDNPLEDGQTQSQDQNKQAAYQNGAQPAPQAADPVSPQPMFASFGQAST